MSHVAHAGSGAVLPVAGRTASDAHTRTMAVRYGTEGTVPSETISAVASLSEQAVGSGGALSSMIVQAHCVPLSWDTARM